MKEYTLELFLRLAIGAASGLHYDDGRLFVISDNSSYLYEYRFNDQSVDKHPLLSQPGENILKSEKPDFESIEFNAGVLTCYGSGSTANRSRAVVFDSANNQTAIRDLSGLYARMKSMANISDEDFNIEGVIRIHEASFFFQRGNGLAAKNGIFVVSKLDIPDENIKYIPFNLPEINGSPSGFTDAVAIGEMIYFLATAERSASTYLDGDVAGSLLGIIDSKSMTVEKTMKISDDKKFEGITFYYRTNDTITFLICEDNDSDKMSADIYKLTVKK